MSYRPWAVVLRTHRAVAHRQQLAAANAAAMRRVHLAAVRSRTPDTDQGLCPGASVVETTAQHKPCPAPAARGLEPEALVTSRSAVLPDGCTHDGTHLDAV